MLAATEQIISLKAKLFRGFADPTRLSIVEALREGPLGYQPHSCNYRR